MPHKKAVVFSTGYLVFFSVINLLNINDNLALFLYISSLSTRYFAHFELAVKDFVSQT